MKVHVESKRRPNSTIEAVRAEPFSSCLVCARNNYDDGVELTCLSIGTETIRHAMVFCADCKEAIASILT